jgi:hypothetical protein
MASERSRLQLTIRYVAEDDTFAVVDTSQNDRVLQGGFKKSSQAQWFADQLFNAHQRESGATDKHEPNRAGEK